VKYRGSGNGGLAPLRGVGDTRAVPTLFLIVFVDLVGFGLVIPLLPFYAVRFAASPQEVTALLAIYSLAQLVTAPLWGRLSDRVGRRPVLLARLTASALDYLWLVAAGLSVLALCGVLLLLPESLPAAGRDRIAARSRVGAVMGVLRRPILSRLILVFFLVILAFAGMESTFALWAIEQFGWGPRQV